MGKIPRIKSFLIILFVFGLFIPNASLAFSSRLFFGNIPKQVSKGERFSVNVNIESKEQAINAIAGIVSFSSINLRVISVSKDKSIVDFWTVEPQSFKNKISFEGVVLNPGYQGNNANVFSISFEAKDTGTASLYFDEGSVLANDGLGTNLLTYFNDSSFKIIDNILSSDPVVKEEVVVKAQNIEKEKKLPVILTYANSVDSKDKIYLKGKGEPNAMTKISFKIVSTKSLGERFIDFLQKEKNHLNDILIENNKDGDFTYTSPSNLIAGAYNAVPSLIDTESKDEKFGSSVSFFIKDSKVVNYLVIIINVLFLFIPILLLLVILYFIPWYSWRRMKILRKKMVIEEDKLDLTDKNLLKENEICIKKEEKEIN